MPDLSAVFAEMKFRLRAAWLRPTFVPYVIKKSVEGELFNFLVGDPESVIWNDTGDMSGFWQEMTFIKERLIVPGDIVFDCGAHHGLTALAFSSWVGSEGRVVAFEPHPRNVDIIRKNIALNQKQNIVVQLCALGSSEGSMRLRNKSNASLSWTSTTKGIPVDVVTLDGFVSRTGICPTFLKIDVEGFELEVLRGAQGILSRSPKLAIEVHASALPRYGGSLELLLEQLVGRGYSLFVLRGEAISEFDPSGGRPMDPRFHLFALPEGMKQGA